MFLILNLGIYCIQGCVWGWAVNKIIENKGYRENWFWWGFVFGFPALLIALTKPDLSRLSENTTSYFEDTSSVVGKKYEFRGLGAEQSADYAKGEWRCIHCRTVNASYVGTCRCGWDKSGNPPRNSGGQIQQKMKQLQQPSMLYCKSCGKQMEANAKFCRYCGTKQD